MEEKDFIKYWIWLTQIPYLGSVMEGRLLAKFKSPQDIYDADEKCLREISGITKRQIASILQARSFDRAEKIVRKRKFMFSQKPISGIQRKQSR